MDEYRIINSWGALAGEFNPPTINLLGDNPVNLYLNEPYTEQGYTAYDDESGDITHRTTTSTDLDISSAGNYTKSYTTYDDSGNFVTVTRNFVVSSEEAPVENQEVIPSIYYLVQDAGEIRVATNSIFFDGDLVVATGSSPTIQLVVQGSKRVRLGSNSFVESDVTAFDEFGVDITGDIVVTDNIDYESEGIYKVFYTVVDARGNSSQLSTDIKVINVDSSSISKFRNMQEATISSVKRVIGNHLSNLAVINQPAVIKGFEEGNMPAYPFVVVSQDNNTLGTVRKLGSYFDEDLDIQVIATEQEVLFSIKCYGEDSYAILNDYVIKMFYGSERVVLSEDAGASFQGIIDPLYIPTYLSTRFVDSAEMKIVFKVIYTYYPDFPEAKSIDGITVSGNLLYDHEGNPLPIEINNTFN